ncbi:hypothetical protein [Lysinibacillus sp. RC79]|uniref:hypothetical protein n=1 Tax=Lysinibacillus sp. RC79 TaxID=3156296 RepID=UPI0035146B58
MRIENKKVYPYFLIISIMVEVGGLAKSQLIQKLQQHEEKASPFTPFTRLI